MPEVSRFYGIVITINYDEHLPPHFHARYAEWRAAVLLSGDVFAGNLPRRALALVRAWAVLHQQELAADWQRAQENRPLLPIPPLD
jgi:hypothetical protein